MGWTIVDDLTTGNVAQPLSPKGGHIAFEGRRKCLLPNGGWQPPMFQQDTPHAFCQQDCVQRMPCFASSHYLMEQAAGMLGYQL